MVAGFQSSQSNRLLFTERLLVMASRAAAALAHGHLSPGRRV
jgi:hypothetical protein